MVHFIGITSIELGRHLGWWERSLFTQLVRSDVMTEVIKTAEKRAEIQKKLLEQLASTLPVENEPKEKGLFDKVRDYFS